MPAYSVSVAYPGSRVTEKRIDELRVTQEEYRHDTAIFDVPNVVARKPYYRTDTPVSISWASGRDSQTFHGYVHHVEPYPSGVQVWCRGASAAFDSGLTASYWRRTFPGALSELARSMRFDVEARPHGRVFETIAPGGDRAWDMLVRYAKEIGYSFYAKNTRLMLHPRTALVDSLMGQAPVLWAASATDRGTLRDFRPVEGAAQPGDRRHTNILTGIDRYTGGRFSVTGGPAAPTMARKGYTPNGVAYRNLEISSREEARWIAKALAEMSRFQITARATAEGSPRVHQTWPVMVTGVDPLYVGAWWTRRVEHILTPTSYRMELELGRDGVEPNGAVPDVRAKRVVTTRNNPQGKPRAAYPPSVLAGGQWHAQWSAASRTFGGR